MNDGRDDWSPVSGGAKRGSELGAERSEVGA